MDAAIKDLEQRSELSRPVLVGIAAIFLLVGIVVAAYGPLFQEFTHRYGVSLGEASEVLSAHFGGALIGVFISMRAIERMSNRSFVFVALSFLAVGGASVATATSWALLIASVAFLGIGFGSLAIGLNQIVAHSGARGRSAVINAVNASIGVGSVVGPLAIARVGAAHYSIFYLGVATLAVLLLPVAMAIPGRLRGGAAQSVSTLPRSLVAIFFAGYVLYVGTEAGIGGWMASHLKSVGVQFDTAAALTAGFWLALTCGRLIVAALRDRIPESIIVRIAAAAGCVSLLVAVNGHAAPVAYLVAGVAIGPIFPTGLGWLARLVPGNLRATSWLFPAAMVGGAIMPSAVGILVATYGVGVAPAALSALSLGVFLMFSIAARMTEPRAQSMAFR